MSSAEITGEHSAVSGIIIWYKSVVLSLTDLVVIVQELCESRGGRPGLSVLTSLLVSVDVKLYCIASLSLSLICQLTSADIKQHYLPT